VGTRLRIAFVGAGFMGQLAHIRSYARLADECELVALAEPRTRTAERVAERYGIGRVYHDHRELVASEELDGIVASQHFTHHAALLPDLYPAVRHLFTEKPLALAPASADRLVALARDAGCTHMVGYHRRSDPATREAKRVVDEWKATERIRYVRISYPSGDWIEDAHTALIDEGEERPAAEAEEPPPDLVTDDASRFALWTGANELVHPLNLLRHLLGERYRLAYAHVTGRLYAFESESGVPATIEMTPYRLTRGSEEEALVAFDRGYVRLRPAPSLAGGRSGTLEVYRDPDRHSPELLQVDPMQSQASDFLRVCRDEASPPTEAAEAAEDMHLVAEVVRARMADPTARDILREESDEHARAWQERLSAMGR
jgi:predicted dehydrogenase